MPNSGESSPEVASRQHILSIYPIVDQALKEAHLKLADLDGIAVTRGPGLPGSLVVGINMAKGLAIGSGLPLLGINHLEGHLYSAWLGEEGKDPGKAPEFPLFSLDRFRGTYRADPDEKSPGL